MQISWHQDFFIPCYLARPTFSPGSRFLVLFPFSVLRPANDFFPGKLFHFFAGKQFFSNIT
jgi:hypothetical protein